MNLEAVEVRIKPEVDPNAETVTATYRPPSDEALRVYYCVLHNLVRLGRDAEGWPDLSSGTVKIIGADFAEERLLEEGYREMSDELLELAHMSLPATFEALPPE